MTNAELAAMLRGTTLFREFTEQELDECVELFDPVTAKAGEVIVHQDDLGDCRFVVEHGRLRVVHHHGDRKLDLEVLKDGDFFGELALVDHGPRSADVIAEADATLLKISQAAISAVAGVYPTAAFKLLIAVGRLMVDRLRSANQRYVDSLLFPLQGKD